MIVGILGNSFFFFFTEIKQNKWGGGKAENQYALKERANCKSREKAVKFYLVRTPQLQLLQFSVRKKINLVLDLSTAFRFLYLFLWMKLAPNKLGHVVQLDV